MEILKMLFGIKKPSTSEKIEETREAVHQNKNRFTEQALEHEKRLDEQVKKAVELHKSFKSSVAYKIAVSTGATKRGIQ